MSQESDRTALVELLLEQRVLMFGEFTLKSGRVSPYFFNLGAIHDGAAIASLGEAYARSLQHSGLGFQSVFGPAYKGIPIAVATAQALARSGRNVGWCFNRKEPKAHGEGGQFVGAPLEGEVVLVDDVLTAGTAVREAATMIAATSARLTGVLVALDRQELMGSGGRTGVEQLQSELDIPVLSLLTLQDVIDYLDLQGPGDNHPPATLAALKEYQAAHCVAPG